MVSTIPAAAKIREARLRISTRTEDHQRPTNLKSLRPPTYSEAWDAEFLFAAMTRADALAVTAFFEALDGPVAPFAVPLAAGYLSRSVTTTAALATVPPRGADVVDITASPLVTLQPGTLIAFGTITDADYQVCEVIETASPVAGVLAVRIAPRVRYLWTLATAVTIGAVNGKFRLRGRDGLDATLSVTTGVLTVKASEAI